MCAQHILVYGVSVLQCLNTFYSCTLPVCSYANTFDQLLHPDVTDSRAIPRSPPIPQSPGFIMANFGLDCPSDVLDSVGCSNTWVHPADDSGGILDGIRAYWDSPMNVEPGVMITFPSLKDREYQEKQPGKLTCQVCTGCSCLASTRRVTSLRPPDGAAVVQRSGHLIHCCTQQSVSITDMPMAEMLSVADPTQLILHAGAVPR